MLSSDHLGHWTHYLVFFVLGSLAIRIGPFLHSHEVEVTIFRDFVAMSRLWRNLLIIL